MPRDFAHRTAARTTRVAWPFPRWRGSVNIERRYAAVVPRQFGRGWTSMSHTHPLATASPSSSTMKPTKRSERMRARAQRRYTASAASRPFFGMSAIASHIPRRWRTNRVRSSNVALRTVVRGTPDGFGPGIYLFAAFVGILKAGYRRTGTAAALMARGTFIRAPRLLPVWPWNHGSSSR